MGNFSMEDLKAKFGTPLYILDEDYFRKTCKTFKNNFKSEKFKSHILFASKALLNLYIARVVEEEGLYIDAVSGGELFTILESGFDPGKIYFHGNNKLIKELELAIDNGIGTIVIDNDKEYENLEKLLKIKNKKQRVLLRINPGIDAHTHEYIATSKNDSKFGLSIYDEKTSKLIEKIAKNENFEFAGFHAHIGSQVFAEDSFFKEAKAVIEYAKSIENKFNIKINELNLGGGFGIYYTDEDTPFELDKFLQNYISCIENYLEEYKLDIKTITIEPGRSLVANAGHTLYTASSVKETYGGKNYVFIDGGMTDNIRPALYGAKYEAAIANKINREDEVLYTLAGKCCESGDIIIKDIKLPKVTDDDLILVSSTGAYGYSMASNYNRIERPAMVAVSDNARLIVRRESYDDLIRNDIRAWED
jgi:diaminopimelate decarboxylase